MSPFVATGALWALWVVSWAVAAVWSRATSARDSFANAIVYRAPIAVGYWMMLIGLRASGFRTYAVGFGGLGGGRLWPMDDALDWAMTGLVLVGFAFCWWARLTLGTLWSGSITRKQDHHVVEAGPYGLVRHPIYTGLLLATLAAGVEIATPSAFVGAALIAFGYWLKARFEERFLAEQLGEAAYADYRRRIPMLVPFLPKS